MWDNICNEFSVNDDSIRDPANSINESSDEICEILEDCINLNFQYWLVTSWDQFKKSYPNCSIAVGWFVFWPPSFDTVWPYVNFNHLNWVDQLSTRSSASQVYLALKQWLSKSFRKKCKTIFNVFINEPTPDKCLAVRLLRNYKRVEWIDLPIDQDRRLRLLLWIQDLFDATWGSYRIDPNSTIMKTIAWIFDPYNEVRSAWMLNQLTDAQLEWIVNNVGIRIDKYLLGESKEIELDTSYKLIWDYEWWSYIREKWAYSRLKLINEWKDLVISYLKNNDGTYKYNILKRWVFIPFPLDWLFDLLNKLEWVMPYHFDCWSWSSVSWSSPKLTWSKIVPSKFLEVVNEYFQSLNIDKIDGDNHQSLSQNIESNVVETPQIKFNYFPWKVVDWDNFVLTHPKCSIALDGYVYWEPAWELYWPYINFNHHEWVDRLATRCTASQVYLALKQWLSYTFKENWKTKFNVYINDPDQDTCLAAWLIKNYKLIEWNNYSIEEDRRIRSLIWVEDLLDVTGGSYRIDPNSRIMKTIAWIFEPYTLARANWILNSISSQNMQEIVESVCDRIDKYVSWTGMEMKLDSTYNLIWKYNWWILIQEKWIYSRLKLINEWEDVVLSFIKNRDWTYKYTILKKSPFIPFPVEWLYKTLNDLEWIEKESLDCWGGSNIVWWSPRIAWSKIKPKDMAIIVNDYFAKNNPEKLK